ncbi:hypothetical protein ACFLRY_04050 [Bacteroidota bacterium]
MTWYYWLAIIAVIYNIANCLYHIFRILRLGKPKDYSQPIGSPVRGIIYSYTGAMNPAKKESALYHIPTYVGGIFYHLGIFISILIFFVYLFGYYPTGILKVILAVFLSISSLSGILIFLKRILKQQLRSLSNPDDYISNILVTTFLAFTVFSFFYNEFIPYYYVQVSILLFYIPLGKLKHAFYFFAARYHLGFLYGWRDVWPPLKSNLD